MEPTIDSVYKFWNDRPCNIKHSSKEIGTKEYFQDVTSRKYFVESHIIDFAEFKKYKDKQVLEIGCGIGTAAQSFIENGAIYTGIDLSDKSIDIAKKRLEVFGLSGNLFQANIEELSNVNDTKFDLVYSFGVLHHTPDIKKSISNIYQMLKPGGEFKMMLYAKNSWKYFEISEGLDQYEAQSGVPIANVYTNEDVANLLTDFRNVTMRQAHIFPYKVEPYKNYIYEKKDYFATMPQELFDCLEKHLGWHMLISCTK
jgi:ubiquinone/menaquinone biosynthesis C-methylase UbiE